MLLMLTLLMAAATPSASVPRSGSILKGAIRVYHKPHFFKEELGVIKGPGYFAVTRRGAKCKGGYWYRLASQAWVCSGWFVPSGRSPGGLRDWGTTFSHGQWYKGVGKITWFAPTMGALARGKFVRLRKLRGFLPIERRFIGKFPYYKLFYGGYVPENAVVPWPTTTLRGIVVNKKDLPLVFVTAPKEAIVYRKNGATMKAVSTIATYGVRQVKDGKGPYLKLKKGKNLFVKRADVALATGLTAPAPVILKPDERWVEVDLANNILYAVEGKTIKKVFLTAGSDETPTGNHRVYWKLIQQTFNRQRNKEAYYLEAVPWVMFFKESYGIHGAYWHDEFGRIKTHGCINLSPVDAKWLFNFLSPVLPPGYISLRSTKTAPGALIRLHR